MIHVVLRISLTSTIEKLATTASSGVQSRVQIHLMQMSTKKPMVVFDGMEAFINLPVFSWRSLRSSYPEKRLSLTN